MEASNSTKRIIQQNGAHKYTTCKVVASRKWLGEKDLHINSTPNVKYGYFWAYKIL
jgi:hypothetical protein